MTYPPTDGTPHPGQDPNQPQPPYDPTSNPPYSDPYAAQGGSPGPYAQPAGHQYEQQPGYPPPFGYPQGPGYAGYPPPAPGTNILAILSLVMAFVFSPAGIVLGHIAKKQIARTGEEGAGLATAGLIASYIITGLYVLFCCGGLALAIWSESQHVA
ncbi:MAG TPA: DUF4190 domain-containing protein [Micromonosporaceae bacterium]|nr:DUF4190 domain-containing protein [Micromonosporaceae bacterium]